MDGSPFTLGGREFIVPRLRVGSYKRALRATDAMQKAAEEKDPDFMMKRAETYIPIMLEILRPNYPELTLEELENVVSLQEGMEEEFSGLLKAASALRKVLPGEAVSP